MSNLVHANTVHEFQIDWGLETLLRLLSSHEFETVLDIGSGQGEHARLLRHWGKEVYSIDMHADADYRGDFLEVEFDRQFDVVWCCHVLEHQRNVGLFLEKIFRTIRDGGVLAMTVPVDSAGGLIPGHLTRWNVTVLCYNLILAGFDCSEARIRQSNDLGLIVEKRAARGGEIGDSAAFGSLEELAPFFPFPLSREGVTMQDCNWGSNQYRLDPPKTPGPVHLKGRFLQPEGIMVHVP